MAVNIKKEYSNNSAKKPDISSLVYGKVPPQATELEEAVLGVLMLESDKTDYVLDIIPSSDYFYADANQKIYEAVIRIHRRSGKVDLLTVTEELRKTNELELIGGAYYLTRLTMAIVSGAHIEEHSRIIVEKYMGREVIRICGQAIGSAYEDSMDVFDLLEIVESNFSELNQSIIRKEVQHIGQLAKTVTRDVTEQRERKVEYSGVPIGFDALESKLSGWQPGHLIILAARPGVGKTSFVMCVAMNAATHHIKPMPVAVFSLEMQFSDLVKRAQSAMTEVRLHHINHPVKMTDEEFGKYTGSVNRLQSVPIFIDDTAYLTINELRVKARKLKSKNGIELIIIDYLQLMTGDAKSGNREQEISKISRDLKKLAKELEVPIIALSQLNRDVEKRANKKPMLADLRESGAIEQDADEIILMSRPGNEEEQKMSPETRGSVEFDIAKNRHGDTGVVFLFFEREIQKWHNSSPYIFRDAQGPENHFKLFEQSKIQLPPIRNNSNESIDDLPF